VAKKEGICKLMGKPGQYVNAHIVPEAHTRLPTRKGERYIDPADELPA
jgi:hypothetical protein